MWRLGGRFWLVLAVSYSLLVLGLVDGVSSASVLGYYSCIFGFGDSLTDTGNYVRLTAKNPSPYGAPPYGTTFFGLPTGRASDGRLVIDFIAQEFGLANVTAIQEGVAPADFQHGANFAIISATANNGSFFAGKGMDITPFSLDTQMFWFRTHMQQLAGRNGSGGGNVLSGALVALGEIGGNDYNFAFSSGVPRERVRAFVPAVVDKLAAAVEELIAMGARAFMVPGNLPFGCAPLYLRRFAGAGGGYDARTGCLSWYNRFAEYHNRMLTARLDQLRLLHPGVTIVYADWYGAMMSIFQSPGRLAQEFGLANVTAIQEGVAPADFQHGANFAIISATANNGSFFAGKGMDITPFSLDTQMFWFRTHMQQLAGRNGSGGGNVLSGALVALGEIGGNDYNFAFSSGVPRERVRAFVPAVVDKLAAAVEELIAMGARAFMVPGNLPFGCAPLYLRRFAGAGGGYDARTGCLSWYNRFAEYHNRVLTARLDQLRLLHPGVTIVYADWYGAMMSIFQSPGRLGITNTLLSCCGNQTVPCGKPGCTVCDDPSTYGSWDGTHPTEAVYKVIADGVLHGPHASPLPLAKTCPPSPS